MKLLQRLRRLWELSSQPAAPPPAPPCSHSGDHHCLKIPTLSNAGAQIFHIDFCQDCLVPTQIEKIPLQHAGGGLQVMGSFGGGMPPAGDPTWN